MGISSSRVVNSGSTTAAYHESDVVHISPSSNVLFKAIGEGDAETVTRLLKDPGLDLSKVINSRGQNPVHIAIELKQEGIAAQLVQFAIEHNSMAIHDTDREGYTPLMLAVELGNIPLAQTLIAQQGSIATGLDTHCSAERISEKHRTLSVTSLMIESLGNTAQAYQTAIKKGLRHFDEWIIGKNTPLRKACEARDIDAAQSLLSRLGVDAALVLARVMLMRIDFPHHAPRSLIPAASIQDANVVKTLISAQANLAAALNHVIEANQCGSAPEASCILNAIELLCLNAPGTEALDAAIEKRDVKTIKLLEQAGVSLVRAVVARAKSGNVDSVHFMFSSDGVGLRKEVVGLKALMKLAEEGDVPGVRLLADEGMDTISVLTIMLYQRKHDAVKTIVNARVDVGRLLTTLVNDNDAAPMIKTLIDIDVDVTDLLIEKLGGPRKNLSHAKLLIAAGAPWTNLVRASAPEQTDLRETLMSIANEVASLQRDVDKFFNRDDPAHVQTVGRILDARRGATEPGWRDPTALFPAERALSEGPEHMRTMALLLIVLAALKNADWPKIAQLVADNPSESDEVLIEAMAIALKLDNLHFERLLMSAGAPRKVLIQAGIKARNIDLLLNLTEAGIDPYSILWHIAKAGAIGLAKTFMEQATIRKKAFIDPFELFRNIALKKGLPDVSAIDQNPYDLNVFIPGLTDGAGDLVVAYEDQDTRLANALIKAGVNTNAALDIAIRGAHIEALQRILPLTDRSRLLAQRLDENLAATPEQSIVTQILLYLDTDDATVNQSLSDSGFDRAADHLAA